MKPIDIELERARRAFDGPEAYPGELVEAVLVGLVGDMQRPGVETPEARAVLVNLCQRITARVANCARHLDKRLRETNHAAADVYRSGSGPYLFGPTVPRRTASSIISQTP